MFQKVTIECLEDLTQILKDNHIGTSKWLKSPETLFEELQAEEVAIGYQEGQLLLTVVFSRVQIFSPDQEWTLHEDYQVRRSDRKFSCKSEGREGVSEKLLKGENYVNAARRGLREELFANENPDVINHIPLDFKGEYLYQREYFSYPGLQVLAKEWLFSTILSQELFKIKYWEVQKYKTVYFNWFPVGVDLIHPTFDR